MDFSNKVVLITGASSGIGASVAVHFSKYSAKLVLVGRNSNNLTNIAEICSKNNGLKSLSIIADVTKDEDLTMVIDKVKEHFGRLDTLVNNAGILIKDSIKDTNMDKFDTVFETNIRAVFNLTRLAVPLLKETKGSIVNISSVLSHRPLLGYLSYGMSKAAMDQFTKYLAIELGPDRVRVNAIRLGYVKSNIFRRAGVNEDALILELLKVLPINEVIEGDDVGKMVAYLASDGAKSVTGAIMALDGGFTAV